MIYKEGSDATNKHKYTVTLAHHHFPCSVQPQPLLTGCLSIIVLDLFPNWCKPCYHICNALHILHILYPCKPTGGYLFKVPAVDTHSEEQLISSWKTRNGDKVTKTLVDIKNQPLLSQNIHCSLKNAGFRVVVKK